MSDESVPKNTKWYDLEDKIERNVRLAHDIGDKVKELGMKRAPIGAMGANLSDLCIDLDDYVKLINQFLEVDIDDKEAIRDILVGIDVCLDHIRWQCTDVKKPLDRVIDYCYEDSKE